MIRRHPYNREVIVFNRWRVPYAPAFGWTRSPRYPKGSLKVVIAVGLRPWLWRSALRFCPSWRHPFPPREYVHFRTVTMYGGEGDHVDVADAISFLHWCRKTGRSR